MFTVCTDPYLYLYFRMQVWRCAGAAGHVTLVRWWLIVECYWCSINIVGGCAVPGLCFFSIGSCPIQPLCPDALETIGYCATVSSITPEVWCHWELCNIAFGLYVLEYYWQLCNPSATSNVACFVCKSRSMMLRSVHAYLWRLLFVILSNQRRVH